MHVTREYDGAVLRVAAPAKVNLTLHVLAREISGYHQLETLFCALELADTLEFRSGEPGIRLEVEGAELGPVEDNLVHRAARAFYATAGIESAVSVRLRKEIPSGAGLGGGSSDAATTLHALNQLHGGPLDRDTLLEIAAGLGSDVPFFLCGSPLALAWGRGERLMPLTPLPRAPVLVVVPGFGFPTPEAYRELDAFRTQSVGTSAPLASAGAAPAARLVRRDELRTWEGVATLAHNDFEAPTYARYPELAELKALLLDAGASVALLSGSGSALFAAFPDEKERDDAASALHAHGTELRLIPTSTAVG